MYHSNFGAAEFRPRDWHGASERRLQELDVRWTILRPARFMTDTPFHMTHISDQPGYSATVMAERHLNAAILRADIRDGFEEYLDILDCFYADDIEASSEGYEGAVIGKAAVRSRVAAFVTALHVLAEVGVLIASIHAEPIRSDADNETHSQWTLELNGATGRRSVLRWRSCRRWRKGCVVYERHYDIEQIGGPLTVDDLYMLPQARDSEFIQ